MENVIENEVARTTYVTHETTRLIEEKLKAYKLIIGKGYHDSLESLEKLIDEIHTDSDILQDISIKPKHLLDRNIICVKNNVCYLTKEAFDKKIIKYLKAYFNNKGIVGGKIVLFKQYKATVINPSSKSINFNIIFRNQTIAGVKNLKTDINPEFVSDIFNFVNMFYQSIPDGVLLDYKQLLKLYEKTFSIQKIDCKYTLHKLIGYGMFKIIDDKYTKLDGNITDIVFGIISTRFCSKKYITLNQVKSEPEIANLSDENVLNSMSAIDNALKYNPNSTPTEIELRESEKKIT